MEKRYAKNINEICTSADALIFVGCSSIDNLLGEEEWGYAAFIFFGNELRVLTTCEMQTAPYEEEYALYHAIRMALEYCKKQGLTVVDIIYDFEEKLQDKLPCKESTNSKIIELNELFHGGDARLYKTNLSMVKTSRLIDALRRNTDRNWLRGLDPEAVFVTLVNELARGVVEDEYLAYDIKLQLVYHALELKKVTIGFMTLGEDKADDEESLQTVERKKKVSAKRKKSILDLIIRYAESIMKENMTIYHLLYGYACFCVMPDHEIYTELELKKEEYPKVAYAKNKIEKLFSDDKVKIDPHKLKQMIPLYLTEFEAEVTARDDYKLAMTTIHQWRNKKSYADEVIAVSILHNVLLDDKNFHPLGLNQGYLSYSSEFAMEADPSNVSTHKMDTLEEIAKKSNELYDVLTQKIFGQDAAVQKFVQGYINSELAGKSRGDKPAATYLFAGPPGVGKTYLARAAAKALGVPMKIFDMSEYMDDFSANGLIGFEKTYRAAVPGTLTTFVAQNPASILLIDEIEKAHITTQMQFLQILEGARLKDKYYDKEVNFEKTIIIFTTNCGKSMYEDNEAADLSSLSETEILDALREDGDFPNELCSRFASGNIIMFNHLQSHYLTDIVQNKMNEIVADMENHYQLQITFDKLLPELFLFQAGSGVDARVASSQSAEMIKDAVVDFVKDQVEKQGRLSTKKVHIKITLDEENKEVYSRFVKEEESNILVVSDTDKFRSVRSLYNIIQALDEKEMLQIMQDNAITFAVIDLHYKAVNGVHASNALGIESVGMNCFHLLREKAPQIPVYVLQQPTYGDEDKKAIVSEGARALFTTGTEIKECSEKLNVILEQLYIQRNLELLKQKGQRMSYKIRYHIQDKIGIIEIYDLALKTVGMDDAALRRKAKQSKVFDFERPTMRFSDIIGAEQAKRDFRHFINYMQNIDKYVMEGADTPKGVLLYGPPGTGKTSLAKALAGECDALFLNTTGASIRNAANPVQEIKDLFKIAYTNAPAILFIDEIDVIAKERTGYDTGTELLVNTLLTEMEGFSDKDPFKPVFVVAATNYSVERRADRPGEIVIDPALVRRFDNPVYVGLPSREERKQYIYYLLKKKNYADKISEVAIDYVAEHTGGRSLAFLKRAISNMTNRAIDENKKINDDLLTETLETQLYGEKRELDEAYRLSVARHEAGHAYVSFKTGREPKFITIVSRGNFGGYVSYGDGEDVHNLTKEDFLNYICQALAGRAAEMVYYGESGVNTGASSDLEHATKYALKMICYFGMGNLGLVSLDPEHILETSKGAELLEEANKILEQQMKRAMNFIREGQAVMDRVVEVLMDKSYIQGENLISVLEEGEQMPIASIGTKSKVQKWYVVVNGRKPGIYTTWAECQEQVSGYSNAVYRSYTSEEEAKKAFQASKIGVRNVRDKKLLYHLAKLSDIEHIASDGLLADKEVNGKKYLSFHFHAYAPEAIKVQKENPKEVFVYLCISREWAAQSGYKILMENPRDGQMELFDYETGINKIDWKQMEQINEDASSQIDVQCVGEERLALENIPFIYTPDEESAKQLMKLCPRGMVISVNKRMFLS